MSEQSPGGWPDPTKPGVPPSAGWWWLQFSNGPGPRFFDGTFWKKGAIFSGPEDYADCNLLGPCLPPAEVAAREAEARRAALEEHKAALAAAQEDQR